MTTLTGLQTANAYTLLNQSFESLQGGQLRDALFFYFAGSIRRQLEMGLYPPDSEEGNAKSLYSLEAELSEIMDGLALAQPDEAERALRTLVSWTPVITDDFQPVWESSRAGNPQEIWPIVEGLQSNRLAFTGAMCTLMKDPAYANLLRVVRDTENRPSVEEFVSHMRLLLQLEQQHGLRGIATQYAEGQTR